MTTVGDCMVSPYWYSTYYQIRIYVTVKNNLHTDVHRVALWSETSQPYRKCVCVCGEREKDDQEEEVEEHVPMS